MRKQLMVFVSLTMILALGTVTLADGARGVPHRYMPRSMDGRIVQTEVPGTQTAVAAWAYRSGAQYDIAVASTDSAGEWSEPLFFGRDDGIDQIDPVVAADASGNVYLAYTDTVQRRVMLSYRPSGRTDWSSPQAVTRQASGAETPGLLVTADRLIVAFQIDRQIQMIELPLMGGGSRSAGMTDDSDPIGYEDNEGAPGDEDDTIGSPVFSRDYAPVDKKIRPPRR